MRVLITSIVIILIVTVTCIVSATAGIWFGAGIFILLLEEFLRRSIYDVPADPPTKAIPMVWGKFIDPVPKESTLLNAGWYFIPLKGSPLLDIREITGEEIAIRFTTKEVVPGDRSEVAAPVSVYVAVDPQNPVQVFIIGGLEEVAKRIEEQVDQLLRKWIVSSTEGPQTMNQAREMNEETINRVLEGLLAYDVKRIHPEIPTEVVVGYFKGRLPTTPQEQQWKETFEKLTEGEKEELRKSAEERFDLIKKMRDGNQSYPLHSMGVVVRRMVVGNMEPTDETKIAVAKVAAARFFAEEQTILAESVKAEAASYTGIPGVGDPLEQTLLRRNITHKETKVSRLETSPDLTGVIKELGGKLVEGIVSAMTKKKEGE
jgi:hypothetical protein